MLISGRPASLAFHLYAVAQAPQRNMEQQRQAQAIYGLVVQLCRARQRKHPVDLGAQRIVILRQQGFFNFFGVKIEGDFGLRVLDLPEMKGTFRAGKSTLLCAAVGLLVCLRQHLQFGAKAADAGGQRSTELRAHRLLQLPDLRRHIIHLDLGFTAV